MKVIAIVGARLNSSRLPKKHLLDLAGKPLISRVFERLESISGLAQIILATTDDDYNKPLIEWAKENNKSVFAYAGDVNDLVGRIDAVVKNNNDADAILYVCGDSPLIEPQTISRMLAEMIKQPDADTIILSPAPTGREYIHEGFDLYSRPYWDKIVQASISEAEREHVGSAAKLKDLNPTNYFIDEDPLYYQLNHRLSVDTVSDYQFIKQIYEQWYEVNSENTLVSLTWLINTLLANPDLLEMNSAVHQRAIGEKNARIAIFTQASSQDGIGHLRRMVWLARALQDFHGAAVTLHILGEELNNDWLLHLPHQWYADETIFLEQAQANLIDVIVYDVNPRNLPDALTLSIQQNALKEVKQVAIDGLVDLHEQLDLICIPSFYLGDNFPQHIGDKLIYGWDYFLMESSGVKQQIQVLIMTGGSDVFNYASWLPEELDKLLPTNSVINWIQGPFAKEPKLPSKQSLLWNVVYSPEHIKDYMLQADIALTCHGVSFFELSTYKALTLLMLNNKEGASSQEIEALCKESWVKPLYMNSDWQQQLINHLPQACPIDARGAERLASKVVQLINKK